MWCFVYCLFGIEIDWTNYLVLVVGNSTVMDTYCDSIAYYRNYWRSFFNIKKIKFIVL